MYYLAIFRPMNDDREYVPDLFEKRTFETYIELVAEVKYWAEYQARDEVENYRTPYMRIAAFSIEDQDIFQEKIEQLFDEFYHKKKDEIRAEIEARRKLKDQEDQASAKELRRRRYEELKKEFG